MPAAKGEWIDVHMCVNDPSNGLPTDRLDAIRFGCDIVVEVHLAAYMARRRELCVVRFDRPDRLRIGRHVVRVAGYSTWAGNWCWDATTMRRSDAQRIAAYLVARGYQLEEWQDDTDLLPKEALNA